MKRRLKVRSQKKSNLRRYGRIRPLLLALIILATGLFLEQGWWKIGLVMLIALFVGGYYRFRTPY